MKLIGIELGITKARVIALESSSAKILLAEELSISKEPSYEDILESVYKLYTKATKQVGNIGSIGIALPSLALVQDGIVQSTSWQILHKRPLEADLEALLKAKIQLEKNANCLVLSEYRYGIAKEQPSVLGILLNSNIKAGFMLHGKLVKGYRGLAASLEHCCLDIAGKKCWCGQRGCAEMYLSSIGLENFYLETSGKNLKSLQIYQASLAGNSEAIFSLQQYISSFGRFMANIAKILNPHIVVIGGELSLIDSLYQSGLYNAVNKLNIPDFQPRIYQSLLGKDSIAIGAALLNLT